MYRQSSDVCQLLTPILADQLRFRRLSSDLFRPGRCDNDTGESMAEIDSALADAPSWRRERRGPSVTDDAIEKIREMIVSGRWGPGHRLPREADLAAELGL